MRGDPNEGASHEYMASRDIYANGFDEDDGKTITAETCPECEGDFVTEGGETSCVECGLIVNEYRINHAAEKVTFDDSEENRERTGAPLTPTRHDRGLSTEIGHRRDGQGKSIPASKRRELNRLRTHHSRARWNSKAERNLAYGFGEIARIAGELDLPRPVRERACTLFRRAQHDGLLQGRSLEAVATASLYAACRCTGIIRSIEEIATVARCDLISLKNCYGVLNRELGLKTTLLTPQDYIPRFASECDVPARVRKRALELASIAEETGLANGRNPAGVAAACLYAAGRECGVASTQDQLVEVANVTAVTIRQRYYEIRDMVEERD